jgi:sugar phosphate isomerase/epimerase
MASFGIAYTSYAVRMLRGGDIFKTTAAALPAERFVDLCVAAGASGCQMDLSQLAATDAASLSSVRALVERQGLFLELSVPFRWFETPDAFEHVAGICHALGATRLRVGLLYGRRYESFESMDAWQAFVARWRDVFPRLKPLIEKHELLVGIENHKDWLAPELADWLTSLDSPYIGACVDFGNNLSLLEDPMSTVEALAPHAVTTHLKDMAVCIDEDGFHLSEVPLGTGLLPLERMVSTLRQARPDVHLCLEMLTRDPLGVPYKRDRYWDTREGRDEQALERFVADVLSKAWTSPLPSVSDLTWEEAVAVEDENVRLCACHAKDVLEL